MGNDVSWNETSFYPEIAISEKCHCPRIGNLLSPKPGYNLPSRVELCFFHRGTVDFFKPGHKLPSIVVLLLQPVACAK